VPIFCQTILGFSAQQTGLFLAPSAFVAVFTFPLIGKLNGKVDARLLICIGAVTIVSSMFMLEHISPQSGTGDIFWPLMIRGAGTTFMFLPITLATMTPIPREDISAATGFFNLMRQLGGSIGIACLTTILASRDAFHRAVLIEKLPQISPLARSRLSQFTGGFMAKGFDYVTAHRMAEKALDGVVSIQAIVMSFGDIFHLVGLAFIATLPLVFLLGSGKGAKLMRGGAH
jgi:DHA2 family multidrug resistance protein